MFSKKLHFFQINKTVRQLKILVYNKILRSLYWDSVSNEHHKTDYCSNQLESLHINFQTLILLLCFQSQF